MSYINNSLINFLPDIFSYKGSCSKNLQVEKSADRQQEDCSSSKSLSDNSMAKKQSANLRKSLRYTALFNTFLSNKYENILYFNEISRKLNVVFDEVESRGGEINFFVKNKLNEIVKMYSDVIQLVSESNQKGLLSKCAELSMQAGINNWYSEVLSNLSDFNHSAKKLLSLALEKAEKIRGNLSNHYFDKNSYDSLVQEINAVKSEYRLDESIKTWEAGYRAAVLSLGRSQAALHYARASQLQREVALQRLG